MTHIPIRTILFSLALLLGSILYKNGLSFLYNFLPTVIESTTNNVKIFSSEELAQYDGIRQKKLYLAVLGSVFDVTQGKKHYEKGGAYHYFIGKDGSRALITGKFNDESKDRDHVMDLSCYDIFTLLNWRNTFKNKYVEVGVLRGRYFDKKGEKTSYWEEFSSKIKQCRHMEEIAKRKELDYPPCNIAWSMAEGTKVWCTKTSGGVTRGWTGVPRQFYSPGEEKPHCVCVNLNKKSPGVNLKEYDNCPETSTSCIADIS